MGWFDFTFKRRCIAVDLGQSRIKAILAERKGGRVEVLHAFTLDLQEEGLLTLEETNRHISRILLEMGDYPVSLAVPQHVAVSHLIALSSDSRASRARRIEIETQNLTGLSESAIVYDYFRLKPSGRNRNPIWVTVSREQELEEQIRRLHGSGLSVGEVTNAGNALASAYLATQPPDRKVILADIGATSTTVVVLERLQPVYAGSFPVGGELFTEAIASARHLPFDEAETLKKTELIFEKRDEYPEVVGVIGRWRQEFEKVLAEYLREPEKGEEQPIKVMLSGGSSLMPGFLEFLREVSPLEYQLWRDSTRGIDSQTYAVAYGAALAGLKDAPVRSSLLPKPLKQERFRSLQVTALSGLAALLMIGLFFLLLTDASVKREAVSGKIAQLQDLEAAHARTRTVERLLAERDEEYRKIVPIVHRQKRTRDLLQTIALMQEVKKGHDLWFVLLADGRSYLENGKVVAAAEAEVQPGNRRRLLPDPAETGRHETDPEGWNRFVVELALPTQARESHEVLREVVETLNSGKIFQNVDTLASFERVAIVDPSVTLPEQTFSLNLELAASGFPLPQAELKEASLLRPAGISR